jgi:hypothetical protein
MARSRYQGRTVSLSFSAPIELEQPMNIAAARLGMNRSQFLCRLITQHLYAERGQHLEAMPLVPYRVGPRGKYKRQDRRPSERRPHDEDEHKQLTRDEK